MTWMRTSTVSGTASRAPSTEEVGDVDGVAVADGVAEPIFEDARLGDGVGEDDGDGELLAVGGPTPNWDLRSAREGVERVMATALPTSDTASHPWPLRARTPILTTPM